jgi:hypothetical protein
MGVLPAGTVAHYSGHARHAPPDAITDGVNNSAIPPHLNPDSLSEFHSNSTRKTMGATTANPITSLALIISNEILQCQKNAEPCVSGIRKRRCRGKFTDFR